MHLFERPAFGEKPVCVQGLGCTVSVRLNRIRAVARGECRLSRTSRSPSRRARSALRRVARERGREVVPELRRRDACALQGAVQLQELRPGRLTFRRLCLDPFFLKSRARRDFCLQVLLCFYGVAQKCCDVVSGLFVLLRWRCLLLNRSSLLSSATRWFPCRPTCFRASHGGGSLPSRRFTSRAGPSRVDASPAQFRERRPRLCADLAVALPLSRFESIFLLSP